MAFLGGLSAALTAGSQGAAGWMNGQEQARQQALAEAQAAAAQLRQQHQDQLNEQLQNARLQDVDEARQQRAFEKEQTLRQQSTNAADKKAQGLLGYFQKAGVEANPEMVSQYATASGMPTISGDQTGIAGGGLADTAQQISNAVGQQGRGIASQLTDRAMKALQQSSAQKGARVQLGGGMGWAQDPNAVKLAEDAQKQDAAERVARISAGNQNKPTIIQGVDKETGDPIAYRVNPWGGAAQKVEGFSGKPLVKGGTGGGSAQGSQAPLDDMMQRYAEIEAHGKDIGNKKFKFTNTNATREALGFGQSYAQAEGKPAIGAQMGQSVMDLFGLAKGTSDDQQRYARLMASTRAFGDDAAKVFKGRQGFQNISLEVAQATLRPDDYGHPDIIEQKLNRMRHVVKLAALVAPNQAAAADPAKLARFMSDTPSGAGKPNPEY